MPSAEMVLVLTMLLTLSPCCDVDKAPHGLPLWVKTCLHSVGEVRQEIPVWSVPDTLWVWNQRSYEHQEAAMSGWRAEDKLRQGQSQSHRHQAERHKTRPKKSPFTTTMLAARTILLVMLLTYSLHHAAAHFTPTECCFEYAQKPVRFVQSFYETPRDCSLPAIVIVTPTGAKICADPKKSWVKKVMKRFQKEKMNLPPSTA
ncbi:C-C motif chemokine 17 [Cuculus canorus]|uniref:C-C motif chemokine 17 n=1 Tax=Cuculus canorus TaxID=55661 RepID=UPI0023AA3904|nr:C-C motif chemokine 17 [Cuculus canorus]